MKTSEILAQLKADIESLTAQVDSLDKKNIELLAQVEENKTKRKTITDLLAEKKNTVAIMDAQAYEAEQEAEALLEIQREAIATLYVKMTTGAATIADLEQFANSAGINLPNEDAENEGSIPAS